MGFGVRVPGVRISTRGVRVGPKFANVRVSTSGRVSASAGPRIARASVSSRGVRVSTGAGPLRVSGGSGGVRVGGGLGPVFGSLGRTGVIVGAGVGPIWATTRVGGRSGGGHVSAVGGRVRAGSTPRMNLADEYQTYKRELLASGSSRRSRDELRVAAINAAMAPMSSVLAPFERFRDPAPQLPSRDDLARWARHRAIQKLIDSGELVGPLSPLPVVPDQDALVEEAHSRVRASGGERPVHPGRAVGVHREEMPTLDEIRAWCQTTLSGSTPLTTRLFRPGVFRGLVEREVERVRDELEGKVSVWKRGVGEFDRAIAAEVEACRRRYESVRDAEVARREPIENSIRREADAVMAGQSAALDLISSTHRAFLDGDSVVTTIVLQTVLSDNAGSAAPIGVDVGDVLIAMTVPSMDEVIWPERFEVKTNITVAKMTKAERTSAYWAYLFWHTVATAREVVWTAQHVKRVRVLILDEKDDSVDVFHRPLLGVLTVDRSDFVDFSNDLLDRPDFKFEIDTIKFWQEALATGNPYSVMSAVEWFETTGLSTHLAMHESMLRLMEPLAEKFYSYLDVPRAKRKRFIDWTDSETNTTDEVQVIDREDVEMLHTLDLDADLVSRADFWVLCCLLAERWDEDEVDVELLKGEASQVASVLYPFEEADIRSAT